MPQPKTAGIPEVPIYEYQCGSCGKHFDVIRNVSDRRNPTSCESCGAETSDLIVNPSTLRVHSYGYHDETLGYVGSRADERVLMREKGVEKLDCKAELYFKDQQYNQWKESKKPKKMPEEFVETWKKVQAQHPTTPENALTDT